MWRIFADFLSYNNTKYYKNPSTFDLSNHKNKKGELFWYTVSVTEQTPRFISVIFDPVTVCVISLLINSLVVHFPHKCLTQGFAIAARF